MVFDTYPSSLKRKKHQRYVNKQMHILNKSIEDDPLWLGRFVVRQAQAQFTRYADHSGAYLWSVFELIDKKTGLTKKVWKDSSCFLLVHLACAMNDFIVHDCDVWRKERVYQELKDYRKVRIEDVHKKYIGDY